RGRRARARAPSSASRRRAVRRTRRRARAARRRSRGAAPRPPSPDRAPRGASSPSQPRARRVGDLARQLVDRPRGVEDDDASARAARDRVEAFADPPVELDRLALEAIGRADGACAREAFLGREIEDERERRRDAAAREVVDRPHGVDRQAAAVALVRDGRIGEPIGHDDRSALERRHDESADVLRAVREVEEELGLGGRSGRRLVEQHSPERATELGAARLARQDDVEAVAPERVREARGLRRLPGALDALDRDERAGHAAGSAAVAIALGSLAGARSERPTVSATPSRPRSASTVAAARSPLRTQSESPTPSYALPASAMPGRRATRSRMRATRRAWPTRYCGIDSGQRWSRVRSGSAAIPRSDRSSSRTLATSAASSSANGSGRSAPPTNARSRMRSAGARPANLTLENEHATICRRSTSGTTTPNASSGRGTSARRYARFTIAADAQAIPASSSASGGSAARSSSAARGAGSATTTASAASVAPSASSTRQGASPPDAPVRAIDTARAPVRTLPGGSRSTS